MLGQMVARQSAGAVTPTEGLQGGGGSEEVEEEEEEMDGEALVAGLRSEGTATSQAVGSAGARANGTMSAATVSTAAGR